MKWIVKMILALLLCLPVQSWAFPNEPNGFRDLYWGENIKEINGDRKVNCLYDSKETNSAVYAIQFTDRESKMVSNILSSSNGFFATFWNDKLWKIQVYFSEKNHFSLLKERMILLYGEPKYNNAKSCIWVGNLTTIILENVDYTGNNVRITLIANSIKREMYLDKGQHRDVKG